MHKTSIAAALGSVAILAVTACAGNGHQAAGSAHLAATAHPAHSSAPAVEVTDANGEVCTAMDSSGYCPGDDPTTAVPTPASCNDQLVTWKDNGAADQIGAIASDLQGTQSAALTVAGDISSGADPSADLSPLQTALAQLQSDVQAAQANLPPSCVPGLRQDLSAGLTDFSAAAIEGNQGVTEISAGAYTTGAGDLTASTAALDKGAAKLQAATTDIQNYTSSQG